MRKTLLAFLVLSLSIAACATGDENWIQYKANENGYKANFPGKPKVKTSNVQTSKGHRGLNKSVSWSGDGISLDVTTITSAEPSWPGGAQDFFKGVKIFASRCGPASNLESEDVNVGGVPGKHFIALTDDREIRTEYYAFLKGKTAYMVSVVSANMESRFGATSRRFFDSFNFLPK